MRKIRAILRTRLLILMLKQRFVIFVNKLTFLSYKTAKIRLVNKRKLKINFFEIKKISLKIRRKLRILEP